MEGWCSSEATTTIVRDNILCILVAFAYWIAPAFTHKQCWEVRCQGKEAYSSYGTWRNLLLHAVITLSLEKYCSVISSTSNCVAFYLPLHLAWFQHCFYLFFSPLGYHDRHSRTLSKKHHRIPHFCIWNKKRSWNKLFNWKTMQVLSLPAFLRWTHRLHINMLTESLNKQQLTCLPLPN